MTRLNIQFLSTLWWADQLSHDLSTSNMALSSTSPLFIPQCSDTFGTILLHHSTSHLLKAFPAFQRLPRAKRMWINRGVPQRNSTHAQPIHFAGAPVFVSSSMCRPVG